MCAWGDTVEVDVVVPASLSHTGEDRTKRAKIDRCLAPIVTALNAGGVATVGSCCGHGRGGGSIVLGDGLTLALR